MKKAIVERELGKLKEMIKSKTFDSNTAYEFLQETSCLNEGYTVSETHYIQSMFIYDAKALLDQVFTNQDYKLTYDQGRVALTLG